MQTQTGHLIPDIIVIGAMKCGTTSIYRYLAQHPDIGMSRDKETDFFVAEKNFAKGMDWYSAQFDRAKPILGEASPNYTKSQDFPGVAQRIFDTCPQARLIYIVRDPLVRAESQFRHSSIIGDLADRTDLSPQDRAYRHIVDTSRYSKQSMEYLKFFPREQMLFLDFNDLIHRPIDTMRDVFRFAGAAPFDVTPDGAQNDSGQLARVPATILRFAQSDAGRAVARLIGRDTRDAIRGALAFGQARKPAPLSVSTKTAMIEELRADADAFRTLTGRAFADWAV